MANYEEEEQGKGHFLLGKLLKGLLGLFIIGFGVQTWLFVNVFMPSDQLFMKILTVFSFDGMGLVYFLLRRFYRFRAVEARHTVDSMLVFCLVCSGICTALYTYLTSAHFDWSIVPNWILLVCYGISTIAILIEAYVLYYIHDLETAAKQAGKRPTPRGGGGNALQPQPARLAQTASTPVPPSSNYQELVDQLERVTGELEAMKRTRPLAPAIPIEKNQQNGNGKAQ